MFKANLLLLLGLFAIAVLAKPLTPITLNISPIDSQPLIASPYTNSSTTNANIKARCFEQRAPYLPQLPQATFEDCQDAIAMIIEGQKPGALRTFGRNPGFDVMLPKFYNKGNCQVLLDTENTVEGDTISINDVADAAWTIATKCIFLSSKKLGGKGIVGPKQIVTISVFGGNGASAES